MKSKKLKNMKNVLVKFDFSNLPYKYHNQYPFLENEHLIFLGEIEQMPGHCILAKKDGKVLWGYHTENFKILTEDEV